MLAIYEVDSEYIDYMAAKEPNFYKNKKPEQTHTRKYIGVVFSIDDFDYFVPLTSYKPKHDHMSNSLDFLKINHVAAINLNCMFPVSSKYVHIIDMNSTDLKYRAVLREEIIWLRFNEKKVKDNAKKIYQYKMKYGDSTPLGRRCNDFKALEKYSKQYERQHDNQGPQK